MFFRISYTIIILFLISGCSSGPDYKRDNLFDPEANSPKAKFAYHYYYRAEEEYDSYTVIVNAAVINQNSTLELKSDKDGVIFSQDNITNDTLKIGYTKLSGPALHTISLLLDGVKQDEFVTVVSKAHKVKMYEPTWNDFQPSLKWSKYKGDDFESYKLKIFEYFEAKTIKEFTDINDTVFTPYEYPIRENFRYHIETSSTKFALPNSSNQVEIKLKTFKPPYTSPISHNDQLYIYYSTCISEAVLGYECFINTLSSTNESKTKSVGNFYPRSFMLSSASTSPELLVISDDDINLYDYRDLSFISDVRSISERVDTYHDSITSIFYNQSTSNYFITFGFGSESGPFTFDSNFEPVGNNLSQSDKNGTYLLGTNENTLFAVDSYSSGNLISYSIDPIGNLTKTNERSLDSGPPLSEISNKHNKLFLGNYGKIFSADSNLDELGYLPNVSNGYKFFRIKESSPDTLYASSYPNFLHIIHIPSNQIVLTQEYHYEIKSIRSVNNKIFLILNSSLNDVIVPLKPID